MPPTDDMAGAQDTIYLCNFRVSVDGEWLCLKELQDVEYPPQMITSPEIPHHNFGNFGNSSRIVQDNHKKMKKIVRVKK